MTDVFIEAAVRGQVYIEDGPCWSDFLILIMILMLWELVRELARHYVVLSIVGKIDSCCQRRKSHRLCVVVPGRAPAGGRCCRRGRRGTVRRVWDLLVFEVGHVTTRPCL